MAETDHLLAFVLDESLANLPSDVRVKSKQCFLDWMGVSLGGMGHPAVEILLGMAQECGGKRRATVVGHGTRTSVLDAALVNGTMAHVLDYDDAHSPTRSHLSAPIIPALLAAGEAKGVTGGQLLTAYVVGVEVAGRVGVALGKDYYDRGWHATGVLGRVGAAVGVGKLLGLDEEELGNALGLAATQVSGLRASFGTMGKAFNSGKAANDGLLSALMAAKGFTGAAGVLDGGGALAQVFAEDFDGARLTQDLGRTYQVSGISLKPHASCLATHPAIDGILSLRRQYSLNAEAVEAVQLDVAPICVSIAADPDPQSGLGGKFSVSFCAALALLEGRVGEDLFTDSAVIGDGARALMGKIGVDARDALEESEAIVEVRLTDGSRVATQVTAPRGDPRNPLLPEEVVEKFKGLARPRLSEAGVESLIGYCANLEDLADIRDLLSASIRS